MMGLCIFAILVIRLLQNIPSAANAHPTDNPILWHADMEEGDLYDWVYDDPPNAGGGVFNTGGNEVIARASSEVARTGNYSAEATITNAYRVQNGSRAVRLMRWTDKAWHHGGDYFPADAYYSTWMYFPTTYNVNKYDPWDPGDGGWWNVFQFKSRDKNSESQPIWTLNVAHNDENGTMYFYLYSKYNTPPHGNSQIRFHYRSAAGFTLRLAICNRPMGTAASHFGKMGSKFSTRIMSIQS